MVENSTVKLIECVNTWQGEGPSIGRRMLLCRFKYCNLKCKWCDTIVKMRAQQEAEFKLKELQDIIKEEKVGLMITGGEPTYSHQLAETIKMLNNLDYPVANVETNGCELYELIKSIDENKNVQYIFSPKFFNQHQLSTATTLAHYLEDNESVFIKLVCEDNMLVRQFLSSLKNNGRIYLMPQGQGRDELIKNSHIVFDMAEEYKVNFTSRDHLIYSFV